MIDPDLRKAEDEGWHELHALIDSVPAAAVELPGYFDEGWSVKDLLAHIGAWLAQAGVALEQIGSGTYRAEAIDVDALNGRYLETLRALPFDVVRAQADAARTRLLIASAAVGERARGDGGSPPGKGGVSRQQADAAFWIRKAGPDHILAVTHLRASVRPREDRPVTRRPVVVDAMGGPLVEVLPCADKARVGDLLAAVSGVVNRALETDREIIGVELVKLLLLIADHPDLALVGRSVIVARPDCSADQEHDRRGADHWVLLQPR